MASENTSFDAGFIAAVASILGVVYLFGAMLGFVSNGEAQFMLLANSPSVTTIVGVLLSLAAGLLATGHGIGRILGTTSFGAIVIFGGPLFGTPDPIQMAVLVVAAVLTGYMILKNPVSKPERSSVDESKSATRVGSTLR